MRQKISKMVSLILVLTLLMSMSVHAEEMKVIDFNNVSKKECNSVMQNILGGIVNNDISRLNNYVGSFTTNAYSDITDYVNSNNLDNGIGEFVIDYVYPDKSSTGDTVIMVNTKIWNSAETYNKVYLFEFHVDSTGDIYGFNVWEF